MMEWFRQLGRALRNLARTARANPAWAIHALAVSPFRLIGHLFGVLITFVIVTLVLTLGANLAFWYFGVPKTSALYAWAMPVIGLAILLVTLRALLQPFILAYGYLPGDDTHGSAALPPTRKAAPMPAIAVS